MAPRRTARALTAGVLTATLLSLPLIEAPAGAQTAAEKRAEAEQVADQLEQLRIRASQLDEQYAQRMMELEEVQQSIIDAEDRVAGLQEEYDRTRAELDSYAVAAYIGGDDVPTTETLLQSEAPNEVGTKVAYLTAASGDRQELLDQVTGARVTLDAELARLHDAEDDAERLAEEAEEARDGAQQSVADEEALLAQVEGELADLLAEEEAARAAAAQRRAEEEARQQAAEADQAAPPAAPTPDEIDQTNETPTGPPPTVPPTSPGGPPAGAAEAVSLAWSLIGVPYVWGGSSPSTGFDCSGFTSYVWGQAGYSLPHSAAAQAAMTIPVSYSELQPGDLVFYGWGYIHHVALYVGGGQIVHAPGRGRSVRVDSVYYWDQMHGAGRLP